MSDILLTIAIPAYNRPQWLRRSLLSIIKCPVDIQQQVEIVVSDDSTIADGGDVYQECITDWHGAQHYERNQPSRGMAGNWNHCICLAQGRYILILHDDDYLEPKGVPRILETLKKYPQYSAFLFGVNVVNDRGNIQKRQSFRKDIYLPPTEALKRVLSNSSFVRFPGMVLERSIVQRVGYFDETIGEIADIDRWVNVFHTYGVFCNAQVTSNYTVHSQALTMNMFNESIIQRLLELFERIQYSQYLDCKTLSICKASYFYQFILAGTVRYLKHQNVKEAQKVFSFLKRLNFENKPSLKWQISTILIGSLLVIRQKLSC